MYQKKMKKSKEWKNEIELLTNNDMQSLIGGDPGDPPPPPPPPPGSDDPV